MIKERSIGVCILLTIVTCGIYGIYWFVVLTNDIKTASKDESLPSGGMAVLLVLITCGIYSIYWAYKMGKALAVAKSASSNIVEDNSILYLILQLVGLAIINYALMQSQLNEIAKTQVREGQA